MSDEQFNLLVFLHPNCACSRSSLRQIERLLATASNDVSVQTIFYCPPNKSDDWVATDLWDLADRLGATRTIDHGGIECENFLVTTSGHAMLFSKDGNQLFSGGVTSSRGHEGDNQGHATLAALLRGRSVGKAQFPVFGCPIIVPEKRGTSDAS